MSAKRKKTPVIYSSSSEDERVNNENIAVRSSERIRQKRNKEFHKPTRDDEWKKITPTKSPEKYSHLKPRKLVNNFTRENHRYNYDPYETSGDESMEDFIADTDEESTASSDKSSAPKQLRSRVKGKRRKLVTLTDSDDSDENCSKGKLVDPNLQSECTSHTSELLAESSNERSQLKSISVDDPPSGSSGASCAKTDIEKLEENRKTVTVHDPNKSDSESEEEIITPRRKRNKSSVFESDDEDDNKNDRNRVEPDAEKEESGRKTGDKTEESDDTCANTTCKATETVVREESIIGETVIKTEPIDPETVVKTEPAESSCSVNLGTVKVKDIKVETSLALIAGTANVKVEPSELNFKDNDTNSDTSDGNSDEGSSETEEESGSGVTDSSDSDDDTVEGPRVRVRMLKKKRAKEKLFEKFREERQRKLQKQSQELQKHSKS